MALKSRALSYTGFPPYKIRLYTQIIYHLGEGGKNRKKTVQDKNEEKKKSASKDLQEGKVK